MFSIVTFSAHCHPQESCKGVYFVTSLFFCCLNRYVDCMHTAGLLIDNSVRGRKKRNKQDNANRKFDKQLRPPRQ